VVKAANLNGAGFFLAIDDSGGVASSLASILSLDQFIIFSSHCSSFLNLCPIF
jgi:hypothetical protein